MASNRIKKYSRQIVCQDMILSCQPDHIEQIPLLKSGKVSAISLRNHKLHSGGERATWLQRDLDLSGMLMCWHLWSSRSALLASSKRRVERQRGTVTEKREKVCESLLTLRKEKLYMAVEKYLLFLMPRETRKKRAVLSLDRSCSRKDRIHLSAFYVDTALGLCQYQLEKTRSQNVPLNQVVKTSQIVADTFSPERMCFPGQGVATTLLDNAASTHSSTQAVLQNRAQRKRDLGTGLQRHALSLYCPSVLTCPDIQDIAQSGLMTLEGSLSLEFC